MTMCSDRLVSIIEKGLNKEVNVTELTGRMTMDVVFNCAFGIDADIQKNTDNEYLYKTREIIKNINTIVGPFYFLSNEFFMNKII